MGVNLDNHRWIDLQHSEVNWKKSNPEEGIYDFDEKTYVDYKRDEARPEHWLTWVRYDPQNRRFDEFRYLKSCGYQPVLWSDKLYWPEHLVPDESGYYVVGDVILMQYPILRYVKEQQEIEALTARGGQAKLDEVESEIEREGGSVEGVKEYFDRGKEKANL